jgi:cytochrome P450
MTPSSAAFRPPRPTPQPRSLGPIALLKTLGSNPIECWTQEHFERPVVMGGIPFGRVAVVSDPACIRKVLVEDSQSYRKSRLERRILSPRLRQGLVAVEGEQWERQRRILAPLFTRKHVRQFSPAMTAAAAALVERWRKTPTDTPVDLKTEMSGLSLDALVRSIFQEGLGADPEAMRQNMVTFFATTGRIDPLDWLGVPEVVPRITHWRVRRILHSFDQALDSAVNARRLQLERHFSGNPPDMLGFMLAARDPHPGAKMNDAEVKANVLTFIFAGQETTSTALTWAIYLLSQSADWAARVAEESERELTGCSEGIVERLHETRAVIDEAMRLYPPIVGITRTAKRRDVLAGWAIERGTMVVVSPYVLHRHRLLWQAPDIFDPSRFLGSASRPIDRYAYLPFGVGPRMCIGAAFALQEATLALATIMKNFSVALAPGQSVWPVQRYTLRPRDPVMMLVRPRE